MSLNEEASQYWIDDLGLSEILIGEDRFNNNMDSEFSYDTHLESSGEGFDLNRGEFINQRETAIPAEPMMDQENELDNLQNENKTSIEYDGQSNENEIIVGKDGESSDSNSDEEKQSFGNYKEVGKLSKIKKEYRHLKKERRPKGEKNHLQANVKGHWTKNFLQSAKKPHLECILKFLPDLFHSNEDLKEINKKNGICMEDFVILYKIPELDQMWKDFFANKVLYRELMLSRTSAEYRLIFAQFLHVYEKAFIEKKFDGIAHIEKKKPNKDGRRGP